MMATDGRPCEKSSEGEDEDEVGKRNNMEIISKLGKEEGWPLEYMYEYQGFWYASVGSVEGAIWMQQNFKPRHDDILLVTLPKSGTTWFKPLLFSVMNRTQYPLFSTHPLLNTSPHDLVPFLELYLHQNIPFPDPYSPHPPQLFQTHLPFTSLSQYVMESRCRIVYVCRNPKDVFVSLFCFLEKLRDERMKPISLEKALELFCKGISLYGPFWDHVLGYWKASLESPERVMFLRYEDMKRESSFHLKRLAEFMGCPFSTEEEKQGLVNEILEMCSFENLRNLEVNKTGRLITNSSQVENHRFFRKGEVGDWKRHLTDEMVEGIDKLIDQKLAGSGLAFHDCSEEA